MAETKIIPFSSREEEQPEDNWPAPKVGKRQRDQVNRAASRFFIFQILIHRDLINDIMKNIKLLKRYE